MTAPLKTKKYSTPRDPLSKVSVQPVARIVVNVTCGVHQGHETGSDPSACLE
jgi:hypothetical protein